MREDALRSIAAFIKENDDFTVVAHTAPDGDTLGASLALYGLIAAGALLGIRKASKRKIK